MSFPIVDHTPSPERLGLLPAFPRCQLTHHSLIYSPQGRHRRDQAQLATGIDHPPIWHAPARPVLLPQRGRLHYGHSWSRHLHHVKVHSPARLEDEDCQAVLDQVVNKPGQTWQKDMKVEELGLRYGGGGERECVRKGYGDVYSSP